MIVITNTPSRCRRSGSPAPGWRTHRARRSSPERPAGSALGCRPVDTTWARRSRCRGGTRRSRVFRGDRRVVDAQRWDVGARMACQPSGQRGRGPGGHEPGEPLPLRPRTSPASPARSWTAGVAETVSVEHRLRSAQRSRGQVLAADTAPGPHSRSRPGGR